MACPAVTGQAGTGRFPGQEGKGQTPATDWIHDR